VPSALTASADEILPLVGIVKVTGLGGLMVTPSGATPFHPALRLTVELKPSTDDNMIVAD